MASYVSEACQINDLDHPHNEHNANLSVSEACQINDLDHFGLYGGIVYLRFRSLSDQ